MTALRLLLLLAAPAFDEAPQEFEVTPVAGDAFKAAKLQPAGAVIRGVRVDSPSKPQQWQFRDLLGVRFNSTVPPARPMGTQVVLAAGEALSCNLVASANADQVVVRGNLFGECTIPTSAVAGLILDADASDAAVISATQWIRRKRTSDAVLFRNFDETAGGFSELSDTSIKLEVDKKERVVNRNLALAIAFDPSLVDAKATTGVFGVLRLIDGTAIRCTALDAVAGRADALSATTTYGPKMTVKLENLVDLAIRNGRAVYLSDLTAAKSKVESFFDDPMPSRNDRNVLGDALRVDGRTFQKGLGARSGSTVDYNCVGFEFFDALVAVDEAAGANASVRFVVALDGRKVFDSGETTSSSRPKSVHVPIGGAKTLTLAVAAAARGDVEDFADWCDARFVRPASAK